MTDPAQTTVFAGVDGRTDTRLPAWYRREKSVTDPISFGEAIRSLPRAIETTVAYNNPYTEEWVETERFNAIVDPERLAEQDDPTEAEALFHVPTSNYAIINPTDVYGALEETLRSETLDGQQLGDVVFGEIRQYRGGGEVHMDILFDGVSVDLPRDREPITMGVSSGYDFFGGHAVYVEGFAQDTACSNSIRQLTDRKVVKHVGDVGGFGEWWEQILGQLGLVADDLQAFIADAGEITVDFTEMPFEVAEFYRLLEFPEYLADRAASDASGTATDPFEIDMWTLHSGATYALTHFFTGKEGTALDRYVRTANDILFNPETTIETVEQAYEQAAADETDRNGQTGIESQMALAQIERVGEDVREKAETFEARAEALQARFTNAGD